MPELKDVPPVDKITVTITSTAGPNGGLTVNDGAENSNGAAKVSVICCRDQPLPVDAPPLGDTK